VLALLTSCVTVGPAKTEAPRSPKTAAPARPAAIAHRGTFWYFVDNITPDASNTNRRVQLWAALPPTRSGQTVRGLKITPTPTEILTDPAAGNRVAYYWSVDNPTLGQALVFRYDFSVENRPVAFDIEPGKVQLASPRSPEAKRYTTSEPWLEASPEIGEFSHIFIAMARALGIPARTIIANWYQGSGHAWAEIFLPPYGWIPVDTSGAQLIHNGLKGQMPEENVHKFMQTRGIPTRQPGWLFGHLYPNRLEVFVGENLTFTARSPGGTRTFNFMPPGGNAAWPPGILLDGLSKKTVHAGFFLFDAEAGDEARARAVAEEQMASGFLAAGLHQRAIAALKRRLQRKPHDVQSLFQLGQAYFKLRQYEAAVTAFRSSLRGKGGSLKRTTDTWSRIFLGMCKDALGRREEAIAEYNEAIAAGADYQGALDTARKFLAEPYQPDAVDKP